MARDSRGGLNRFNKKSESFFTYQHEVEAANSLCNDYVWHITDDQQGGFWLTTDHGLCHMTFRNGNPYFESISHDPADPNSLSSDYTNIVHIDKKEALWVSTSGGGLNHMTFDSLGSPHVTRYRRQDGLPNEVIYCILEDQQGRLWLSTDYGLSCLEPALPDDPQGVNQFIILMQMTA